MCNDNCPNLVGCIALGCRRYRKDYLVAQSITGADDAFRRVLMQGAPAANPKAARAVADGKAPLDYLESAVCDPSEARVMFSGAQKYGRRNFRDSTIKATTYVGALRRHVNAFASGEDIDPDSGEPHLAHIRACCAVLMSAQDAGTYHDDRRVQFSITPQYQRGVDELAEELAADAKAPPCIDKGGCDTPAICRWHGQCMDKATT
jgi:hypothetical protein